MNRQNSKTEIKNNFDALGEHKFKVLLISIDELWLKGKNKSLYFKSFRDHVEKVILQNENFPIKTKNENQQLIVECVEESETGAIYFFSKKTIELILKIPGLSCLFPAVSIKTSSWDLIVDRVINLLEEKYKDGSKQVTFKVMAKRVDKNFFKNSMEINRDLGELILDRFANFKVDVLNFEIPIFIKIYKEKTLLYFQRLKGIGGLPTGMTGRLLTLISGGFDSPVASYLMSKRGCAQDFIFFYAYPFVSEDVLKKVRSIVDVLAIYQLKSKFYVIGFGEIQQLISKNCREQYRTLLFRYFMLLVSEMVCKRTKAKALVTGDNLGQVSSQTLDNICLLSKTLEMPIFRPLIGFNKIDIINMSKEMGTHDLSIIPHDDACSLFAPAHPILRPDKKYWKKFLAENDFSTFLKKAVDDAQVFDIK